MNMLVIDCSVSAMHIGLQKGTARIKITLDVGMKQSEKLLPTIDYLFAQLDMHSNELDCIGVCTGPGSFTGLRLAVSAAKAFSLAHSMPGVISVIDAKKGRFYGKCFYSNEESVVFDADVHTIAQQFLKAMQYLVVGPDAHLFYEQAQQCTPPIHILKLNSPVDTIDTLFVLTMQKWNSTALPMQDYDGPQYVRKSEAEEQSEKH